MKITKGDKFEKWFFGLFVAAALIGSLFAWSTAHAECSMTCFNGKCITCCCSGNVCNCF